MGGGSESTIIIGPSKSILVYALHCLGHISTCSISGVCDKIILYSCNFIIANKIMDEIDSHID